MESCIANRLNNLYILYYNLEKKINDNLSKNEINLSIKEELKLINEEVNISIKEELEEIKRELKIIKGDNNFSLKGELEIINGELKIIKNERNYEIKDELHSIKNELRYQKNINLDTSNYLEYTLLYADFKNCSICMYCPSEPYEPDDDISEGPIIDNEKYTILKNILNN